jgi:hypothetical protein
MDTQTDSRQSEIDKFWRDADHWMQVTGFDEAELLKRFPSFKGTKPRVIGQPTEPALPWWMR